MRLGTNVQGYIADKKHTMIPDFVGGEEDPRLRYHQGHEIMRSRGHKVLRKRAIFRCEECQSGYESGCEGCHTGNGSGEEHNGKKGSVPDFVGGEEDPRHRDQLRLMAFCVNQL